MARGGATLGGMTATLTVTDLVKSYGAVQAVRGLSFAVAPGEIFGLLGPNGAGKTTTIECLIGLRDADGGSITICGHDLRREGDAVRERIGVQLQATALPERITVREALQLFASFYAKRAAPEALLARFSLTDKATARFETLSGGQKQRLAMALAMVNEPEVLFLDEPTAALDPQARRELHEAIRGVKAAGRSVLLSTHYIDEAELLCDRVAIVDHGRIIALDTPANLIAGTSASTRVAFTTAAPLAADAVRALEGVSGVSADGRATVLASAAPNRTIIALVHLIESSGGELVDLQIRKPSLEDVFIQLTGRALRD